jgi:ubiquinone/menaquinone biosynthesis C-methylase UbiE
LPEQPEKAGLRNAWGRVAIAYDEMWAERTADFTARGLDLLGSTPGGRGIDVACGPGLTTVALAERLGDGQALGVDFAAAMIERATEKFGRRARVAFMVDDAERLSLPDAAFDALTCSFGLMYCYDARAALGHMARVLRPGGRMLQVVWGRAPEVWWVPVIELIESRAEYYSSVCPMMFFYGLPGVLPRMFAEAGLEQITTRTINGVMRYTSPDEAVAAAVQGGPLAGLYNSRLSADAQAEVRDALAAHVRSLAQPDPAGISLPAEVVIAIAARPALG